MNHYFTETTFPEKPEPYHRICQEFGMVSLQQRGKDNFAVRYCKEVHAGLTYAQACKRLGQALMHQMSCDGKVDNRTRNER